MSCVETTLTTKNIITTYQTTKEGETTVNTENCQLNETTVSNTETIKAKDLWNNSESCSNLKLENDMITRIDTKTDGELVSGVFHISAFKELVPSWNILINDKSILQF